MRIPRYLLPATASLALLTGLALIPVLTKQSPEGPFPAPSQTSAAPVASQVEPIFLPELPGSNQTGVLPAGASSRRAGSDSIIKEKLTETEQRSLWQAFSEARRKVREIPEAWAERGENLGYDFYALHPKQNLAARFGPDAVRFASSAQTYTAADADQPTTAWEAQLRLRALAGREVAVGAKPKKVGGSRVEYLHGAGLTEWYDNGIEAMEHGLTVDGRPAHLAAGEKVVLEISLEELHATPSAAGEGNLIFRDGERDVLAYEKLVVFDATGKELPARMEPTGDGFLLAYHDAGAAYPVMIDPLIVNQEAKFNRIDGAAGDRFGYAVSVSGDTVVIGALLDDDGGTDPGSVYAYRLAVANARKVVVVDHLGNPVSSGGSASGFDGQRIGTSRDYSLTLTNSGELGLDLQNFSLGGTDPGQFSLALLDISANPDLAQGASLPITITFQPVGGSGSRNAALVIFSNDTATPVYSINLSGLGLSESEDADGDGMNDWAEYDLRGFGFDWETPQHNLVSDYYEKAPSAGLATLDQVAGLQAGTTLLDVNQSSNRAKFTIELRQSDDLAPPFIPIVADPARLSVDARGRIVCEVDAPAGKRFYLMGVGP